jgi:hypothetical protein
MRPTKKDHKLYGKTLTMRIDEVTKTSIDQIANHCDLTKAEVIRKSIRLTKNLLDLNNKVGDFYFIDKKGEKQKILLLID